MTKHASRYISKEVQRQLREVSRDRCCICGHLIPFDRVALELGRDILYQHRLIYFSKGGENTEENLLLVDPNCHVKIHLRPDLYPVEKLKEAKRHWAQMRRLVPVRLPYESDDDGLGLIGSDTENLTARFHVNTLNLQYQIDAPPTVEIGALSKFMTSWIMRPLIAFVSLAPYPIIFEQARLSRMQLGLSSHERDALSPWATLSDINIQPQDSLLAWVDFRGQAMQGDDSDLRAKVTLNWYQVPRDLDLHAVSMSSADYDTSFHLRMEEGICYRSRGSLRTEPWVELNRNVQAGFGPEVISFGPNARGPAQSALLPYPC
jgi:hypothetical protein